MMLCWSAEHCFEENMVEGRSSKSKVLEPYICKVNIRLGERNIEGLVLTDTNCLLDGGLDMLIQFSKET